VFSFFSQNKSKSKHFLFVALIFILVTAFLASCDTGSGTANTADDRVPDGLLGRWADPRFLDGYEITRGSGNDTLTIFRPDMEWEGEIFPGSISVGNSRSVTPVNDTAGVIIFRYSSNAPVPARPFSAVYYETLIPGTSVRMATVIVLGSLENADTATLREAIEKFTVDTQGNFIQTFGTYLYE